MIRIRHLLSRANQRMLAAKPPGLSIRGVVGSVVGAVNNVHRQLRNWTHPNPTQGATLIGAFGDLRRSKPELVFENALLRHQAAILNRKVRRPKITA